MDMFSFLQRTFSRSTKANDDISTLEAAGSNHPNKIFVNTVCDNPCTSSSSPLSNSSAKFEPSPFTNDAQSAMGANNKIHPKEILSWTSNSTLDPAPSLPKPLKPSPSNKESRNKRKWFWTKYISKTPKRKSADIPPSSPRWDPHISTLNQDAVLCNICLQYMPFCDSFRLKECRCIFCVECLRMYIIVKLQGNQCNLPCPERLCELNGQLTQEEVNALTSKSHYKKFLKLREECNVNKDPNRVYCPMPNCGRILVLEDNVISGKHVFCPACRKSFCAACSEPWNTPHNCLDEMVELSDIIKRCPKCYIPIERSAGCAQIVCQRCQHTFCWFCLESIANDYLLLHYDKGKCRGKLGHNRAALWTLRVAMVFSFIMTGAMAIFWLPLLLVTVGPCYVCKKNCIPKKNKT